MKKHIFPLVLIGVTILIWQLALPHLPEKVPVHWAIKGEANGYETKIGAMLSMVAIQIVLYLGLTYLPKMDPKKENYKYFLRGYHFIIYSLFFIFFILNVLIILTGLGYNIPMSSLGTYIVGFIFIIIGNFMPTVRTNFFMGIRTPWTLSNEVVWKKTHRFGGKIFFLMGIIFIAAGFLPANWINGIIPIIVIIGAGSTILYSYWIFKREINDQKHL
ncbi:SdpI family protein [Fictibacillus gelatini]|uniref:SdpI family protein n=1 Tax=Fictibacillus gelatini TaxID=225985 RepID=UPI0003F67BD6|nr:SdpI family protein [Fictibacillus gelatini]